MGKEKGGGVMKTLAEVEKEHILLVLKKVGDNKLVACGILGISMPTLYAKLKKYGVFPSK